MQEKYTENIDQLDEFYKDALQEASVEPPANMWDRIGVSYEKQRKPKGFFFKRYFLLLLFLLLSITGIALFFVLTKKQTPVQEQNPLPNRNNTEQPLLPEGTNHSDEKVTTSKEEKASGSAAETSKSSAVQSLKKASDPIGQDHSVSSEKSVREENDKNTLPPAAEKQDSVPPSVPAENPKKKIRFRDKYKEEYNKDSLRPLFIPVE